jgi:hypothetical protein
MEYVFSEQTMQPGHAVSLKCVAVGTPPPHFVWSLDGFQLPDSERQVFSLQHFLLLLLIILNSSVILAIYLLQSFYIAEEHNISL